MDDKTRIFCDMIRNRSEENQRAMRCFFNTHGVLSPAVSILRQEMDSMIRVIYLLTIKDLAERRRLINSTLEGKKWMVPTSKGKLKILTDRAMIDIAQQLQGWTQSVYRFGCAFIHLSNFHNHLVQNPFDALSEPERQDILSHMRYYHGGPCHDNPDMDELSDYLPQVLEKITDNLRRYLEPLERDDMKYF
jgi:uncharacterized protein (DUF1015 family)